MRKRKYNRSRWVHARRERYFDHMMAEPLEPRLLLAGVTLITHGYEPTSDALPGWVSSMADAIATDAGPGSSIYDLRIALNSSDVAQAMSFTQVSGPLFSASPNGQAIIELDWADASGIVFSFTSAATIAQLALPYLTNAFPSLGIDFPLADLPIHLIGHSRGGSVVSQLAEDLGEDGVWVDQLTTLDPHPVDDVRYGESDPAVNVFGNVVFADNYYELNSATPGESIQDAYNVDLTNVFPAGLVDQHEDVHAYYYGTINTSAENDGDTSNGDTPITIDPAWYEYSGTGPRDAIGFYYSLIEGGTRPISGIGADFGGEADRVSLPSSISPQYPDIGSITLADGTTQNVEIGAPLDVNYYVQTPDANATITWYLSPNQNPFNNTDAIQLEPSYSAYDTEGTVEYPENPVSVSTTDAPAGDYYVYAEVDDDGLYRYAYIPGEFAFHVGTADKVAISTQPPTIATAGSGFGLMAEIEDSNGNVILSNDSEVTLSVASGPVLNGTVTVQAVNGTATFSGISLDTAGTYTLSVTDSSENLLPATSGSIAISPAAASQLVFAPHSGSATAGAAISPAVVVDVEDQFGNLTSGSGDITISVVSGPSDNLNGTLTLPVGGSAVTFVSLSLDNAGVYRLGATDGTLAAATSGSFTVNPAAASQMVFALHSGQATAGVVISPAFVVDVEDPFGNLVGGGGNVTVAVASGPAANLDGTLTMAASGGTATFSTLFLDTAGTFTLSATDGTLPAATSGSFTVNPAAASQLVFAQQPTNATAGVAVSPALVVDVEDQFGNLVNDSDGIAVSASGPGSFNEASTTTVSAVNGVATFGNMSINTAGTYTLHATDVTDTNVTAGISRLFTVNPAAASQLVFAAHSGSVTAGVAISPAFMVDVEDQFGNLVNDSDSITVSASGPGSFNEASTTTASAVNGVAMLGNLSINTAGTYRLHAMDVTATNVTAGTSGLLTVNPAAASQLVFSQQPTNATAGATISPAPVVDIEDQFGNLVANNDLEVALAISSGAKGAKLSGVATVSAVNGVATFSGLSINEIGSFALRATDGTLTTATSGTFTISPVFAWSQQPAATVTAGSKISSALTVDFNGANGAPVSNANMTVQLSVQSGPGTLAGVLTATAKNGVATFKNLELTVAGTYTLQAVSGSFGPIRSNAFVVVPAAAKKLVFATLPAITTITDETVIVNIEDQFGNIETDDSAMVTLGLQSAPKGETLDMPVDPVNGVATFTNVLLSLAGTYEFKATSKGLTKGTSPKIAVSPS
jgi:hypothetical protein